MLKKKERLYHSEGPTDEHMGLGLATSQILVDKHGGEPEAVERPGGRRGGGAHTGRLILLLW